MRDHAAPSGGWRTICVAPSGKAEPPAPSSCTQTANWLNWLDHSCKWLCCTVRTQTDLIREVHWSWHFTHCFVVNAKHCWNAHHVTVKHIFNYTILHGCFYLVYILHHIILYMCMGGEYGPCISAVICLPVCLHLSITKCSDLVNLDSQQNLWAERAKKILGLTNPNMLPPPRTTFMYDL